MPLQQPEVPSVKVEATPHETVDASSAASTAAQDENEAVTETVTETVDEAVDETEAETETEAVDGTSRYTDSPHNDTNVAETKDAEEDASSSHATVAAVDVEETTNATNQDAEKDAEQETGTNGGGSDPKADAVVVVEKRIPKKVRSQQTSTTTNSTANTKATSSAHAKDGTKDGTKDGATATGATKTSKNVSRANTPSLYLAPMVSAPPYRDVDTIALPCSVMYARDILWHGMLVKLCMDCFPHSDVFSILYWMFIPYLIIIPDWCLCLYICIYSYRNTIDATFLRSIYMYCYTFGWAFITLN